MKKRTTWLVVALSVAASLIGPAAAHESTSRGISITPRTGSASTMPSTTPSTTPSMTASLVAEATTLDELLSSADYRESDADLLRLYQAFFNREPDVAGAAYWIDVARQGSSLIEIAEFFTAVPEFTNTYADAASNEQFLERVYQNVLGRNFDQDGFDYWLAFLNEGTLTRGATVRWVTASQEFKNNFPFASTRTVASVGADGLEFFRSTEARCATHAANTGNPAPQSARFDDATVVSVDVAERLVTIEDGSGDRVIVDFDLPVDAPDRFDSTEPVVMYSTDGPGGILPFVYSFGCPPQLYLGTLAS